METSMPGPKGKALRGAIVVAALLTTAVSLQSQNLITTVAGSGPFVFPATPVPALSAPLGHIAGVAIDAQGNVYATDVENHLVVKVAPDGNPSVVARVTASPDLPMNPTAVTADAAGNVYFVDDSRVRRVTYRHRPRRSRRASPNVPNDALSPRIFGWSQYRWICG